MRTPETEYRFSRGIQADTLTQRVLCPAQCISENLSSALKTFCDVLSSPDDVISWSPVAKQAHRCVCHLLQGIVLPQGHLVM